MKQKSGCLFFGIVLLLFFILLPIGNLLFPNAAPFVFGSIFGIVILGLIGYWLAGVIARRAIGAPTVEVSSSTLRVGEPFSVTCQQTFKRTTTVPGIEIALIRREIARYSRGTDTVTVTFDDPVKVSQQPGRIFNAGETFLFSERWQIPPDAMHSFKKNHNTISWLLRFTIGVKGWRDITKTVPLTVLPEIFSE